MKTDVERIRAMHPSERSASDVVDLLFDDLRQAKRTIAALRRENEAMVERLACYYWLRGDFRPDGEELREFRGLKDKVRRPYVEYAREMLGLAPTPPESDDG